MAPAAEPGQAPAMPSLDEETSRLHANLRQFGPGVSRIKFSKRADGSRQLDSLFVVGQACLDPEIGSPEKALYKTNPPVTTVQEARKRAADMARIKLKKWVVNSVAKPYPDILDTLMRAMPNYISRSSRGQFSETITSNVEEDELVAIGEQAGLTERGSYDEPEEYGYGCVSAIYGWKPPKRMVIEVAVR